MAAAVATTTFAEQREFAAKVGKEKAAVEWAFRKATEEQRGQGTQQRRRAKHRRTTRDGRDIFAVTFFDGDKPKRTDWLAGDAKREADFRAEAPTKRSLGCRLPQSRSEPCLRTIKRERKRQEDYGPKRNPFRTLFPMPLKGVDMRRAIARDQSDLFKPRPETVALSATEKREMRTWGVDVDALVWPNGFSPPCWVKAIGNTTNKWANREMSITAAREEQEFVDKFRESSPSRKKKTPSTLHRHHHPAPTSSSFSSLPSPPTSTGPPPPPWVKDLPPVRDGRRQLASGEIIPFLEHHVYPEGGVAEARKARRREKEAFLETVFVTSNPAAPRYSVPRRGRAGGVAGREPANRGKSGEGNGGCARNTGCSFGGSADADGEAATDAARSFLAEGGAVTPGAVAVDGGDRSRAGNSMEKTQEEVGERGGNGGVFAENPSSVQQQQQWQQQWQQKREAAAAAATAEPTETRDRSGDPEEESNSLDERGTKNAAARANPQSSTDSPPLQQQPKQQRGVSEGQASRGGAGEATRSVGNSRGEERAPLLLSMSSPAASVSKARDDRETTPSPMVTSSVSVLDMGVLKPSE